MPWKVPVYLSKEICIYKKPRSLRGFLMNSLLPVLSRGYVAKGFWVNAVFLWLLSVAFSKPFWRLCAFFQPRRTISPLRAEPLPAPS